MGEVESGPCHPSLGTNIPEDPWGIVVLFPRTVRAVNSPRRWGLGTPPHVLNNAVTGDRRGHLLRQLPRGLHLDGPEGARLPAHQQAVRPHAGARLRRPLPLPHD